MRRPLKTATSSQLPGRCCSAALTANQTPTLTEREILALKLAAEGLRNKEAAVVLDCCRTNVRKLWHSACVKLGANNKCHAIALAIRRKII